MIEGYCLARRIKSGIAMRAAMTGAPVTGSGCLKPGSIYTSASCEDTRACCLKHDWRTLAQMCFNDPVLLQPVLVSPKTSKSS